MGLDASDPILVGLEVVIGSILFGILTLELSLEKRTLTASARVWAPQAASRVVG